MRVGRGGEHVPHPQFCFWEQLGSRRPPRPAAQQAAAAAPGRSTHRATSAPPPPGQAETVPPRAAGRDPAPCDGSRRLAHAGCVQRHTPYNLRSHVSQRRFRAALRTVMRLGLHSGALRPGTASCAPACVRAIPARPRPMRRGPAAPRARSQGSSAKQAEDRAAVVRAPGSESNFEGLPKDSGAIPVTTDVTSQQMQVCPEWVAEYDKGMLRASFDWGPCRCRST